MAVTNGTNITALEKPAVGIDTGPGWATALNNSIDAVDGHDHTTNKGTRITTAAINVNADLEFNENQATELKGVVLSNTNASTDNSAIYQTSGNLYWRNSSGTGVQITDGSGVKSGAGSIDNMGAGAGNQAGASYSDTTKSFSFFTDQGNSDLGKINHSDLNLYKFSDDNTADTDYVTLQASSSISGAGGTITVPGETGTMLTTSTSYGGGNLSVTATSGQIDLSASSTLDLATTAANSNITLSPHGSGEVVVGNGGATGKLSSSGNFDLVLETGNSTTGNITITDGSDGNITFAPNGTGEIVIGSGSASGKITSNGANDLVLDTNSGTNSGSIIITDGSNGDINITPNGTGSTVLASTTTQRPLFELKQNTDDATSAEIKFNNAGSAVGESNDVAGLVSFYSVDSAGNTQKYGEIEGKIESPTNGSERGQLILKVAEFDGTNTAGLAITGSSSDGRVDVNLGAGSTSVTAVAGTLTSGSHTIGSTVLSDGSLAYNSDFDLDIEGDLTIDVNGGDVTYKDDGTAFFKVSFSSFNTTLTNG